MDNNGNFEQQFTQNLKSAAAAPVKDSSASSNKLLLVITIALAAITLVESIALVITLNNYFSIMNEGVAVEDEAPTDEEAVSSSYIYDEDYNLIAFNLTCTTEDGSYYSFTSDKNFEQHNTTGAITASGPYTITNDSLISLSGSNKVLYYDGVNVADGLTIYTCEEAVTEADTNDSETE